MGLALEDAYEILHKAILALGPERKTSICYGENTLVVARQALYALQTAIIYQLELLDPEYPLKIDRSPQRVVSLTVPVTAEHLESIKRLGTHFGETQPEMTAAKIILTWLDENRQD